MVSCSEIQRPTIEPFFAVTVPPPKQELRWSNGKMPKSLDPARAAAAPETDIVRAVYEGLTELDSKTLKEVPAAAEKWESSEDKRVWIFTLRKDARWSNGERVTSADFVRSWKRLAAMGDKTANRFLFQNVIGMQDKAVNGEPSGGPGDFLNLTPPGHQPAADPANSNSIAAPQTQMSAPAASNTAAQTGIAEIAPAGKPELRPVPSFGVEAVSESVLRVTLELPDKDLPKLVANPIFRPVFGDGSIYEKDRIDAATVTNGPFRIKQITSDTIALERSESYWNKKAVQLETVHFISAPTGEKALDSYKKGELDVVTNAAFEPLALKLLTPYEDFRRSAHSALNFYEINTARAPFSDRRIREALAIAIDRAKLTEGDLEGQMQPANTFFPVGENKSEPLTFDAAKARELMEKAGYPNGENFPAVRLIINRNETQQRVARSVARMWKQNLNIETAISVKEASEIEAIRESGDFDLLRRGVVLPANDEIVAIVSIFGSARRTPSAIPAEIPKDASPDGDQKQSQRGPDGGVSSNEAAKDGDKTVADERSVLTEEDVIFDLRAIPLYYPTSFALVKPYVRGFEINALDAPSLTEINIDSEWRPRKGSDK